MVFLIMNSYCRRKEAAFDFEGGGGGIKQVGRLLRDLQGSVRIKEVLINSRLGYGAIISKEDSSIFVVVRTGFDD